MTVPGNKPTKGTKGLPQMYAGRLLVLLVGAIIILASGFVFADYQKGAQFYLKKEYEQAYGELLPAAEADDARAQFMVAVMYDVGQHVAKNEEIAAIWYQKAAEQGHPDAQIRLASMLYEGIGASLDRAKAYQWAVLAAERLIGPRREKAVTLAETIAALLGEAQLAQAKAVIATWRPRAAMPEGGTGGIRRLLRTGTGFFLNTSGLLLTNQHVVQACRRIIVSYGNAATDGVLRDVDFGTDLATVQTDFKPLNFARFASEEGPGTGASVTVAGYAIKKTKSREIVVSSGQVLKNSGALNNAAWFQTSVPIYRGQSGSPVLDPAGRVIGVARGVFQDQSQGMTAEVADGQAMAVRIDGIFRFLDKTNVSFEKAASNRATPGAGITSAPDFVALLECWGG